MSSEESFGSEHWRKDFNNLAFDYLKYATGTDGGGYISFDPDCLKEAFAWYDKVVAEYKKDTEGDKHADTKIDRHKIISFYILAILHSKPFSYNPPYIDKADRSWFAMLPNEYYCLCMIEAVFFGWHSTRAQRIRMDENYRSCLIILFHRILTSGRTRDPIPLAHIVYFIEKCFFK